MKIIISILYIFLLSSQASAKEELVNIDNLIQIMESLQKDVNKLNERMDNVSQQSYEARKSSAEDRQAMKIIVKKILKIKHNIAAVKKDSNISYSDNLNGAAKSKGRYYKVNAKNGLVLRQKATRNSLKIGVISNKEPVYAICVGTQRWCYVPDLHGYVYKQYMIKGK